MISTGPWWGTPVITFGGVLLTLFSTMWISFLSRRRETAFRWAEARKQLYTSFVQSCRDLQRVRVWPAVDDPAVHLETIRLLTVEFEIIASHRVTERAAATLGVAERLADHVGKIRAESKAGHGNVIVDRFRSDHAAIESEFVSGLQELLRTIRIDLDVKSKFEPLASRPSR